jgi:hypothetical protein
MARVTRDKRAAVQEIEDMIMLLAAANGNPPRKTEEGWVNPQGIYIAVPFAPLAASSISFATCPGWDT